MKGFAISKNLRYAFDILNFQHVDILARSQPPGHYKLVPRSYFLNKKPTYLFARVVKLKFASNWAEHFKKNQDFSCYVPDFMPIEVGGSVATREVLFVLRRVKANQNKEAAWNVFYTRLNAAIAK